MATMKLAKGICNPGLTRNTVLAYCENVGRRQNECAREAGFDRKLY